MISHDIITQIDTLAKTRRQEIEKAADALTISGTAYYVSSSGDDRGDGRTPETAWKTLARVSSASLVPGDGVFFKRGDLFRGTVKTCPGVSYGAYGTGEKPKFYGWDRALEDPALWVQTDKTHHIWKWQEPILDVGTLVFNDGSAHSRKLIPSYIGGRFVCREDESRPFDMAQEMTRDLDLYWHFEGKFTTAESKGETFPIPDCKGQPGELYLRCDQGNPAEVFRSIEAVTKRHMFQVSSNNNVRIDNLCIKYVGEHGITAGGSCVKGLHVSNCELGWIGGCIQHYLGTDPNYPEGGRGTVTRYGNAIEIYGGCDGYLVENCYIYQVYDAGITHQVTTNGKKYPMENILYRNNLIEYCVYGIEYFLEMNGGDTESYMRGIEMCGNIIRHSGYGWGQQRHNTHTPAHIKGWSYTNRAYDFTIHDNICDRAAYRMIHLVAQKDAYCPTLYGNTYIQHLGRPLGQYGGNEEQEPALQICDDRAEETVKTVFKDQNAAVHILR